MIKVQIKLTRTLPIAPEHKCIKGEVFDGYYRDTKIGHDGVERVKNSRDTPVAFTGAAGSRCVAFSYEYERVEEPKV